MADELLRVYLDPAEIGLDGYPLAWHKPAEDLIEAGRKIAGDAAAAAALALLEDETPAIKDYIRERDGHRCLRCGHPYRKGEHGNGEWSPCDPGCHHGDSNTRWVELETRTIHVAGFGGGDEMDTTFRKREAQWRILTVHHLNGIKYDCRWWNLVSLCQRCHLTIQGKVYMDRPWAKPHSEWFKPFAAGFYAWKYLDLELTRGETIARLDELLDLELTQEALF